MNMYCTNGGRIFPHITVSVVRTETISSHYDAAIVLDSNVSPSIFHPFSLALTDATAEEASAAVAVAVATLAHGSAGAVRVDYGACVQFSGGLYGRPLVVLVRA